MPERVFGARCEPRLIDELDAQQLGDGGAGIVGVAPNTPLSRSCFKTASR